MKKLVVLLSICVIGVAGVLVAAWEKPTEKVASTQITPRTGPEGLGIVQYDPPGPADAVIGNSGEWAGNRFDTRNGNPLETGSITLFSAYWGGSDATYPFVGIFNGAGTYAFVAAPVSGLSPSTFNALSVTGVSAVAPGFLAGLFVSSAFASSADSVGARAATTAGQGFHAVVWDGTGAVTDISGMNAMVRIGGGIVVPVELMNFEVE